MQKSFNVIPAKAGIQVFQDLLDPGCHRGGGFVEFCKRLRLYRIYRNGYGFGDLGINSSILQFLNPSIRF